MIYPKLTDVKPLPEYRLLLTFGKNEQRVYDFKTNLDHKFFKPLINKTLFENVKVTDGEIEWASGQDFCPHTLYEESKPV